jgi:hypothetical protein
VRPGSIGSLMSSTPTYETRGRRRQRQRIRGPNHLGIDRLASFVARVMASRLIHSPAASALRRGQQVTHNAVAALHTACAPAVAPTPNLLLANGWPCLPTSCASAVALPHLRRGADGHPIRLPNSCVSAAAFLQFPMPGQRGPVLPPILLQSFCPDGGR